MDFNNGLYVFNGVPGLDASKGERVSKSLQKLQSKIKHLEQVRQSEKETSKNETSDTDKDISLTDIRLKLLGLQLMYMRATLKQNAGTGYISDQANNAAVASEIPDLPTENIPEVMISSNCKETQTGLSFNEHILITTPPLVTSQPSMIVSGTNDSSQPSINNKPTSQSTSSYAQTTEEHNFRCETMPPSTRDVHLHYRLNPNEFPFILGSSTSDSHNVLANFQNVIAKLKSHNVLCGPRHQVSHNCAAPSMEKNCLQDPNKMVKDLTEELVELRQKQVKLMDNIDKAQDVHFSDTKAKDIPRQEADSNRGPAKKFLDSKYAGASTASGSQKHVQIRPTKAAKKEKHLVPTNRIQANLPQVARQRLLRSIRDIKTHLSEDDVSWI